MAVNSFTSNQGTQTALLTDNTGGISGTLIPVMKLSTDALGTFSSIWNGNVGVSSGTINVSTISVLPNIPGGTIGLVSAMGTIGTIGLATVSGNIGVSSGTINVSTISSLPNLPGGSIAVTAGTILQRTNDTIDSGNSSTGTLAANGTYTGTGFDTLGYSAISAYVYSDQSSATNGVRIEFSSDNSAWHDATMDTFTAGNAAPNDGQTYVAATRARYARMVYINGGTNQTAFILNTAFRVNPLVGDLIPVGDLPDKLADHAMLTKASIVGKTTAGGGSFVDVKVNPSGAMQVDPANGTVQVSAGSISVIAGTIGTVASIGTLPNLPQGSITVTTGTIGAGTFNLGTVRQDGRTTQNIITYGTQIAGTAPIAATVVGSASVGAGTYLWLQDVSVTNSNANVLCVLGFGTAQQGTNVLLRHTLGTSGAVGIEKNLGKPVNAGMTNQDLVFSLGGAGTVDVTFSYFISA